MAERAQTFNELYQNRKIWVESSERNGFDEGILKLLTELYPDKAHFVYELLQNAEDAKATSVTFKLYRDKLEFVHNGSRLFSLDDIDSITSIANTTKTKEEHTIGKFGVGFKAVFSYTQSPKIRSGEWNFEINKLVIPTPIEPLKNIDNMETFFTFPFNNPKKTPEKAYKETEIGLKKLPPETLLFLNNIQELTWIVNNEEHKIYKKEQDHIVSLYVDNHIAPLVQYLRFTKNNITIETSSGRIEHLSVALAYKLDEDNNKKLKIVPIISTKPNVFIYFPAEKEDSKLRFLINAPFDSEVSRASIRDTEDNALLLKEITNLQIETMAYLRDNGYLTTEFLSVLPNSRDELPEMYEIFHEKLIELFNNKDFTPTMSGEFRPAKELYKGVSMYTGGPHISEFINDKELYEMLKAKNDDVWSSNKKIISKNLQWSKNTLQNSLADFFLQDLELNEFGTKEFYKWFIDYSWQSTESREKAWEKIITQKDYKGLIKLYRMFYQYFDSTDDSISHQFKEYKLVRCTDGKMYSLNENIYILPEEKLDEEILKSYCFIDNELFGGSKQKNKILDLFKDYFDIEEFSAETIEQEKFEEFCSKYSRDSDENLTTDDISIDEHIKDIKFLLKFYDNYSAHCRLKNISFILTTDNQYVSIDKVYSDKRYGNKHDLMVEAKGILGLSEISIVYKEKFDSRQVEKFINLLDDLHIHKQLWPIPCSDNPNKKYPTSYYTYTTSVHKDYDIYGIQDIISHLNQDLSELIWISIIGFNNLITTAIYKRNQQDRREEMPAKYVFILSESKWILDRNKNLNKPADMTFDDLPDNWMRPNEYYNHPILKAIGFGKNSQEKREEQQRKEQLAKDAGLESAQELDDLKELKDQMTKAGMTKEDIQSMIQRKLEKNNNLLPKSASQNIERRQGKIAEEYSNAENQTYEQRMRSVRISNGSIDVTQYLKDNTKNDEGKMYCQMCHEEFPFKKRNGQYYFEAVQIFKQMLKETRYQYLALCPNCAAEYDEWVRRDQEKANFLLNQIKERKCIDLEESVNIHFSIHNEPHTLYFTGIHYSDLRGVVCPNIDKDPNQAYWVGLENDSVLLLPGDTVRYYEKEQERYKEGKVLNIGENVKIEFPDEIEEISRDFLEKKAN